MYYMDIRPTGYTSTLIKSYFTIHLVFASCLVENMYKYMRRNNSSSYNNIEFYKTIGVILNL